MPFTVTAIDSATAQICRDEVASGTRPGRRVTLDEAGAPCRHCLRPGQIGEDMVLFTYQPFAGDGPYTVPSPIFLHAEGCDPYDDRDELPALLRHGLRAVRSYDDQHDLIDGDVVAGTDLEVAIDRLLNDDRAAYLHVHSATAGCFTCRIDPAPGRLRPSDGGSVGQGLASDDGQQLQLVVALAAGGVRTSRS